jgi:beta-lactam-binding protein with PASTA domain
MGGLAAACGRGGSSHDDLAQEIRDVTREQQGKNRGKAKSSPTSTSTTSTSTTSTTTTPPKGATSLPPSHADTGRRGAPNHVDTSGAPDPSTPAPPPTAAPPTTGVPVNPPYPALVSVPGVLGSSRGAAAAAMQNAGLVPEFVSDAPEADVVADAQPSAGTLVEPGSTVRMVLVVA